MYFALAIQHISAMGLRLDHQVSFAVDPWLGMKPDCVT